MAAIRLTKYQREELAHLRDIAEGEADENAKRDERYRVDAARWRQDERAMTAILDGEDIDHEAAALVIPEIEWHRDKFPDEGGHVRSMNNLISKLRAV